MAAPAEPLFEDDAASVPPAAPIFADEAVGTTAVAGQSIDEGKGRIFPCSQCGADLKFSIGQQTLACPFCGHVQQLVPSAEGPLVEHDLEQMLETLAKWHESGHDDTQLADHSAVRCESCGGEVIFQGTLTSTTCPYCASPLQRNDIHKAENRISIDAVLPFLVDEQRAGNNLRNWVQSLWFAPNDFKQQGVAGKFNGVYLPYFTLDAMTYTRYRGQRGDHYWETVGSGKDERKVRRTRWWPASGEFQRFFDDVLVVASRGVQRDLINGLEPWPLAKCRPFTQEVLAGFFARTYDISLKECFNEAHQRMESALVSDVRRRIGGDEQQIDRRDSQYSALTFKHLMLPVWLLAYRYQNKTYQVVVNAATGQVRGERPWSWVKITLAILAGCAVAGLIAAISQMGR